MYTVKQIIDSFSFSNPEIATVMIAFFIAGGIGMVEYFIAVYLTIKHKKGPFPVWMHTFFFAHDTTAAIVLTNLATQNNYFWFFTVFAIGMYIWAIMEAFCLYMGIRYDRNDEWGHPQNQTISVPTATINTIIQIVVMFSIIAILRFLTHDVAMFYWLPTTNFVMAIGPAYVLAKRGSRVGSSGFLYILIIIGTLFNYAPKGIGLFSTVLPSIYNQPTWFLIGAVAVVISIINAIKYFRIPKELKLNN